MGCRIRGVRGRHRRGPAADRGYRGRRLDNGRDRTRLWSEVPMIIARSPLRITLGGGGTDLPSYYREHEGFLVAAGIDRYVYITIHATFVDYLIVKYSKLESVTSLDELQHPIIREA